MKKNDVKIKVNTENRQVYFNDNFLGVNAENLQSDLIFEFDGEFVNGSPRVEVELDGSKYIITEISKVGNTYVMPIKSSLLTTTQIYMQLVITESGDSEIPIFKSRRFYLIVEESINASTELPDEYQTLYDQIEEKIAEVNNLNVTGERVSDGVEITFTDKQGNETTEKVNDGLPGQDGKDGVNGKDGVDGKDGIDGQDGKDAKINGYNTITIEAGNNITIKQEDDTLTISATGGGSGTSDYDELSNKPQINNITLSGNKTLSDLGIDQDFVKNESDPTVPSHVKSIKEQDIANWNNKVDKDVSDLTNYYNKTYIDVTIGDIESLLGGI